MNTNGFFAKINSDGTTAWSKKVFKTVDRGLIEVDAEGNIYISEQSFESLIDPNTTIKPSVMKFTSDGTFIWGRQLTDGVAYSNASQISAILTYDDRLLFSGKYGNSLMVNIPAIDGDKVSSFWLNYAPSLTSNSYTIGSSSSLTLVNSPMDMGGGWGGVLEANSNTPLTYLYIVAGYSDNNNSAFTQNIAYTRIRFGASAQTSQFSQTATGLKLAQLSATLSTSTTVNADLKRIRFSSAALTSTVTMACTGQKLTGYSAAFEAQSALSTTPNRLRGITETLAANATQTADNTRLRDNSAAFTAFYTELAIAFKNATGTVLLESVATMAIDARKITDSPQFMFSQTQMTARGFNTQYGSASLAASSTFVLVPTYLRRNEVAMTSNTSLTVPGERIRPGTSNQAVQTFVSASTEDSKITGYSAALTSTSQMVTNNQILRLAQANLLSTTAIPLAFVGILVRVEANLQVNGFVLSAGEILNIDLFYQLKIPSETRTLWIEPESRILSIDSETRVNKIKGYPTP